MNLKKPYKQFLILLRDMLILVVIGNVLSIFTVPREMWTFQVVLKNCMFSILMGYPAWKGMVHIEWILGRKLPWLKYPVKRLVLQVLVMSLFAGIIIFIGFAIWIWLSEDLNLRSIISFIMPSLKVVYIFIFLSLILGNAILFFKNWRDAAIEREELKRAHLAIQYQTLKEQVRPHFLFNSLSSLVTLINTDPEKATQFVHKLSDVYRYVLEQRDSELVPLTEEVKFLEDYIYLQRIRYGENLQVRIRLEPDQHRKMVPLSLQMLVENAIKHNEVSNEHPLVIDIFSSGEEQVVIKNNLKKKEVTEISPGLGLENLQKRIAFFTDEPLLIQEEQHTFTVTIPMVSS